MADHRLSAIVSSVVNNSTVEDCAQRCVQETIYQVKVLKILYKSKWLGLFYQLQILTNLQEELILTGIQLQLFYLQTIIQKNYLDRRTFWMNQFYSNFSANPLILTMDSGPVWCFQWVWMTQMFILFPLLAEIIIKVNINAINSCTCSFIKVCSSWMYIS